MTTARGAISPDIARHRPISPRALSPQTRFQTKRDLPRLPTARSISPHHRPSLEYARHTEEKLKEHQHPDYRVRLYPGAGHLLEPPCTPCNRVAPERSGLFNKEVITIQLPCPAPWPRSMQTRRLQAAAKIGPEFVRWLEEDGMLDWGGDPYGHAAAQRQSWDEVRSPPHLHRISAASRPARSICSSYCCRTAAGWTPPSTLLEARPGSRPPDGSTGSGRSYAPRSVASAAWRLAAASIPRRSWRPS